MNISLCIDYGVKYLKYSKFEFQNLQTLKAYFIFFFV